MTIKTWLSIAGATLILLATVGSTSLQSTIVQNGAPIVIDRCVILLKPVGAASTTESLWEDVGFTNISQQTVTQIRFNFEIVDASGFNERVVTGDKLGGFAPAVAIDDLDGNLADSDYMKQTVGALPRAVRALCRVQMVRFDDGSIWREGDGPAGNADIYTPLPGPTPVQQWQWPYDPPTP